MFTMAGLRTSGAGDMSASESRWIVEGGHVGGEDGRTQRGKADDSGRNGDVER
jgi:hypothetical protein